MVICCVKGCGNKQRKYTNVMFHRIPQPVERRNLWLAALGIPATTPVDKTNQYRVCYDHFNPEDYEEKMQYATREILLHLKDTAVPSIFSTAAEQCSSSIPVSIISILPYVIQNVITETLVRLTLSLPVLLYNFIRLPFHPIDNMTTLPFTVTCGIK